MSSRDSARRAHRLTKFYPVAWRERYGEEFEAHLEQEFEETPYSFARTLNVVTKGIFTRLNNLTWRVILTQPGEGKFKAGVLIPIAVTVGVAAVSLVWPISGRPPWPAEVLIGVLFVFVLFSLVQDSYRIRTDGPAKRFSKDRNVTSGFMLLNSGWLLSKNVIGHKTLAFYVILSLDLLLFAYKFGWIGSKRESVGEPTINSPHGNSKI